MAMNIGKEIAGLHRLGNKELRARYAELFGEETRANNHAWLVKRVAWRIQSQAEGGLSERARQRAARLANDADIRLSPPKAGRVCFRVHAERTKITAFQIKGDARVPLPGTVITRTYKGESLQVKVLPNGFEFNGEVFKSLSAVAKAITGQHCNGYYFFKLGKDGGA